MSPPSAVANAPGPAPVPPAQAPEDATKAISDLVHAGKYPEAQQLTARLLVTYPEDERLIKTKGLLEKLVASESGAKSSPGSDPQSATSAGAAQLTGMERVDYDALIELARQAQQTTDLEQQKKLLQQFMDQSGAFVEKHPAEMLMWQLRAASAISLNHPLAGYEAGQRLLMADSNDPNVRRLLAQLKNKGWLDKRGVEDTERQEKYDWVLGTWGLSLSLVPKLGTAFTEHFCRWDSVMEGYLVRDSGLEKQPFHRGTILDSGEFRWEFLDPKRGWLPVLSWEFSADKKTMRMGAPPYRNKPNDWVFTRVDSTH